MPTLGIVIPVYNEQKLLPHLFERVKCVLERLDVPGVVCFVDDGSTDATLTILRERCAGDSRFGFVSLSRNFGHQTAVSAGLRELQADVYVIMDGDLQDPPELIPQLLEKWRAGFEVVYCVRQTRQEHPLKRLAYAAFYRLLRCVSYLRIPLDSGDFCLMDAVVVRHLRAMREHNPFLRGLRTWVGFRQTPLLYHRDARYAGTSKYTFAKLLRLAYDGLISFSFAPLQWTRNLGLAVSLASFAAACLLVFQKLVYGIPLIGWTSTFVLILFMGGVQLLTLGVMGEYLGRVFDEVKGRPLYIAREVHRPVAGTGTSHAARRGGAAARSAEPARRPDTATVGVEA